MPKLIVPKIVRLRPADIWPTAILNLHLAFVCHPPAGMQIDYMEVAATGLPPRKHFPRSETPDYVWTLYQDSELGRTVIRRIVDLSLHEEKDRVLFSQDPDPLTLDAWGAIEPNRPVYIGMQWLYHNPLIPMPPEPPPELVFTVRVDLIALQ